MKRSAFRSPGKHSALVKTWRAVGKGKSESFFLEHSEAVMELLQAGSGPNQLLLSTERYDSNPDRWEQLARDHPETEWYLLPADLLDRTVSVRSTSGLCGLFSPRTHTLEELLELPFLLVCWEVQDPGNVGTLIRSCAALTGGGVVTLGGCRPWSSKVARASAGALFRTPLLALSTAGGDLLAALRASGYALFSALPRGGQAPSEAFSDGRRVAVLIGNESHGLPSGVVEQSRGLTISMRGDEESLNAGVAGSILCYQWSSSEASREQRAKGSMQC